MEHLWVFGQAVSQRVCCSVNHVDGMRKTKRPREGEKDGKTGTMSLGDVLFARGVCTMGIVQYRPQATDYPRAHKIALTGLPFSNLFVHYHLGGGI